ncbi:hypothetical protein LZ554_003681 [Drepanopeziza brunnea f. sp. 'monogermtubi']|nr:hypothetical protein LZ554_003681 [Drepanopeziza brunnea f. sp. 'monogermtubi']
MLRSKSVCAVLLALSFLVNGAQGILWNNLWQRDQVIGYATVSEIQAKLINQDNKLHRGNKLYVEKPQYVPHTGSGFYILNEPGNWIRSSVGEDKGRWYCAIRARKIQMRDIAKIKIPVSLMSEDEEKIVDHIASTNLIRKPKEALRFSYIKGSKRWQLQMLIPTDVITKDDLKLWAQCFESEQELVDFSKVVPNWDAWKAKGYLGKPGPYNLGGTYYGYA